MMPDDSRTQLRAFLRHRRATLVRLRRVNEALSQWDEHDAAAGMALLPAFFSLLWNLADLVGKLD